MNISLSTERQDDSRERNVSARSRNMLSDIAKLRIDCRSLTTNMRGYFIFLQVSDSFVMFGTWFVNLIKYKTGISAG